MIANKLLLGLCLTAFTAPVLAQSAQSPADSQAVGSIADATFANVRAGKFLVAVNSFFGSDSLATSRTADMQNVANQISSTVGIYGPMGTCELVEQDTRGTMVDRRLYICNHRKYATRWILLFIKTTTGWSGANLKFDDQVADHLVD